MNPSEILNECVFDKTIPVYTMDATVTSTVAEEAMRRFSSLQSKEKDEKLDDAKKEIKKWICEIDKFIEDRSNLKFKLEDANKEIEELREYAFKQELKSKELNIQLQEYKDRESKMVEALCTNCKERIFPKQLTDFEKWYQANGWEVYGEKFRKDIGHGAIEVATFEQLNKRWKR